MTPAELTKARVAMGLSPAGLAAELNLTIETIALWERGEARIPGFYAKRIAWQGALAEQEAALAASGLPQCPWVHARREQGRNPEAWGTPAQLEHEWRVHTRDCDICRARDDYVRAHCPPLPPPPLSPWLATIVWVTRQIQRLPPWARPAATGGVVVGALTVLRALVYTAIHGFSLQILGVTALATLAAMYMGAAGGIAYQLVRSPFKRLGRIGDCLTGVVCLLACFVAIAMPGIAFTSSFPRTPGALAFTAAGVAVVGALVGWSWFRERTEADYERGAEGGGVAWLFIAMMIVGVIAAIVTPHATNRITTTAPEAAPAPAPPPHDLAGLEAAARSNPHDAEIHRELGAMLSDSGRIDEAYEQFRQAVRLDPKNAWGHSGLGWAAMYTMRPEQADSELRRAIALDPKFITPRFNFAGLLMHESRYVDTLAQFREAAQIDSTLAWPHGGAADCLRQLGRVAEARAEARTAIRLKPEIPGGYVVLAWTFIQQNAYDSALAYAHQLVHHAPQYAEGWVLEGTMAYYEDQPAEARRAFGTALRLEPRILEHNPEGQRIWHALGAK